MKLIPICLIALILSSCNLSDNHTNFEEEKKDNPVEKDVKISCQLPADTLMEYETMQGFYSLINTNDQRVIWFSSDPEIATVNSAGLIEAKKKGNVMITVQSVPFPDKTSTVMLRIIFNPIPQEVVVKKRQVRYYLPPNNYTGVIAWMQTIHDIRKPGASMVEVDYLRLYCISGGQTYLLFSDDYDNQTVWGGLFLRNPWYGSSDSEPLPHSFQNANLILTPDKRPDRVYHWWNASWPRSEIKLNTTKIWMEAKVRITGPALVQAGIDFWETPSKTNGGNIEGCASDWYFSSGDWQIIKWPN